MIQPLNQAVVVLTEPLADAGMLLLHQDFRDVRLASNLNEEELCKAVSDAQAIITRLTRVSRKVIESARSLKVIVRHGVGVDNIDVQAATEHGVQVVNTPLGLTISVAEFTVAAILALVKRIKEADSAARAGYWRARYSELIGIELFGKTTGIVGLGRIGLEVAKRLRAFGVQLVYYDLVRNPKAEREIPITFTPLSTLLKQSDIVSLHVPATDETFHQLSKNELALMKPSALLINMARGNVIDEAALIYALSSGKLAGAALDVFEREPLTTENPLVRLPNVLLSPHMAGHTHEALERTAIDAVEAVKAVLAGKQVRCLANPEVLERSRTTT